MVWIEKHGKRRLGLFVRKDNKLNLIWGGATRDSGRQALDGKHSNQSGTYNIPAYICWNGIKRKQRLAV